VGKNNKPLLSILIEESKRSEFAKLAQKHNISMGKLLNQCIDKMLMADSIDFSVGNSIGNSVGSSVGDSVDEITDRVIERIVKYGAINEAITDEITDKVIDRIIRCGAIDTAITNVFHLPKVENLPDGLPIPDSYLDLEVEQPETKIEQFPDGLPIPDRCQEIDPEQLERESNGCSLTARELASKLGISRQSIDRYRGNGKLKELGYLCKKIGSKFTYFKI
jgi:DNA-binding XRE family transcriptional regulator